MLSLNSPAFTALLLVMSLLRSPFAVRCLHLTLPLWKMVMELAFYLVINKFPGYVVLAAFVAALALLVYTFRITRVIALCLQGVSPFDEARYAAIDEYAHRMYRPDVSGASLVARDVAASPPFHGASAPAMSSSEAGSSPRQSEGASEIVSSPLSSPSVNGPGPLDRADHEYRPIVVGSVLVTNPNLISAESDTVLAGLSFDELCQLEADERAYLSRNMKIASNCDSPYSVAALSVAPVANGSVASGDAIVNDSCTDVFSGAFPGGIAATTAGTGVCFSPSVFASADLVSVDADDSVFSTKRFREEVVGDDLGVEETSRKRSKVRFTTAVCGLCGASVLRTVARADAFCLGSCTVFAGLKRPRADDVACQKGKRFKAACPGDILVLASGLSGVPLAVDDRRPTSFTFSAAITTTTAGQFAAPIVADTAATTTTATSTAINNPTAVSSTLAASAATGTTVATTARRIAVPRASSRRPMAPTPIAITTTPAMIATSSMATTTSPAPASATNITSKNEWENNKGNQEESDGFDLSAEELDRLLDEIDQELE